MDQLVRDFRKAERECKSPSASEILARLALLNRQSFRICQIPLSSGDGADNPATTFYSVTIGISTPEDEKKAVESGIGRDPVTEKASKPIYEYLVRQAEDRLGPRPAVAPPSPPPPAPAPVTILTPPPTPPSPNPPPPPPKPEKKSNGDGNSSSSYIPYYVVLNEQYLEKMAKLADDLNGLKIVPDSSNSNKVVDSNNHGLEKGAESQNSDSAEPEMDQNDDEQLVPDMPPLEDDFDSVMADDHRMMTMFDSLVLKGYRLFKNCETVVDARRGTPLYKATVRIPEFGEFCICSRDKMRDAIRGAALKLKFYLQSEGIADYDLRPGAIQPYQQREFPLPEGESEALAKADRKPDPNAPFVISLAVPIRPIDQKVDVAPVEAEQVELDPMKIPNTTEKEENDEEELSYHQLLTNQIASIKEVSGLAATNQNAELSELANQIQGGSGGDEPMANQKAAANYVEKVEVKDFSNLNDFFLHGPLTPANQVPPPRSSTSFRPANGHSLDDEFYMKLLGDYHKSETTKSTSTKPTSAKPTSTTPISTKTTSTKATSIKQNFELPDLSSILTEANMKKEDSTVKSEGKSEQQPPVIVASIRTPESAAVVQELMSRSNKEPDEENIKLRVELIKNFNSAYALSKSSLDIMTDLNRITDDNKKKHFSVMTEPMPVPLKDHLVSYVSTVKLTDVAAFSGIGETEQSSRDEAVRQAFAWIKGLSTMLTKFKTLFMITHCPLTIVGELIPNYRGNISMKNKVVPEKGNLIQTTVQLINMGLFYDYGPTEIEAKQKCFSRVMSYLNKLATGIFGEPRGFNPLRNSGLASTERMQESASYQEFCKDPRTRLLNAHTGQVDRAVSPPSASIHHSSFIKRAQLFKNFNQVYDPKKTSVEILNDLNALYPRHQMPPICIQAAYDPITSIYRATARIDSLASLTSTELTESEAKRKAQLKAFHFLKDITSLISHFWKFRLAAYDPNTNQHERSALEMLEDMMRRNAYLIKMSTIKERQSKYRTIIQIVNINSFVGNGSTELESKEAAAINAVDYFEDFAKKIF